MEPFLSIMIYHAIVTTMFRAATGQPSKLKPGGTLTVTGLLPYMTWIMGAILGPAGFDR